jgi:SAM-dependent methyltransferase
MQTEVGRARLVFESCPGCGRPAPLSAYGVIAPFVAELVGLPLEQKVGYRECGSCGLAFFDLRYSESQVETLYGGYRDAEYFRTRRSWEPWYQEDINNAFLPGSAPVEDRVRFASRVLALGGVASSLKCAVDFGGDQGQFFPRLPIRRRVVVELSEKPLLPGIERVSNLDGLSERPDLILVTHVLEHLSEPRRLLSDIRRVLAPTGILYVEVPLDRPRVYAWHRTRAYAKWLKIVSGRRWSFIPLDFASGIAKQRGWTLPRLGVVKESEHINFFSSRSLRSLLESGGFKVVAELAEPHARMGKLRFGRLGMAAVCAPVGTGAP